MNRLLLFISSCLFVTAASSQVTIMAKTLLNNEPVSNTRVYVRDGGKTTYSLNTGNKSEFKLQLEFGKNYQVYVQNARSPVMFVDVITANVPEDKQYYNMIYKMNVTFVDRNDEDIDTTVFRKAFHRVIFDGRNRMIDDSAYNNDFARHVLRQETSVEAPKTTTVAIQEPVKEEKPAELPVIIAGKIVLSGDRRIPVANKSIAALNEDGKVVSSTSTNRFGAFSFSGIKASQVRKIRMELGENATEKNLRLLNTKNGEVKIATPANSACEWSCAAADVQRLVDNNYSINVGGKLVAASPKSKKFYANKDVYLSNRLNTIIKRTKTNVLGTFVFEDLRPDNQYFIGVDRAEIAPGERIDLLNKDDKFIKTLDTVAAERMSMKLKSDYNQVFNDLSIGEDEMKMDVKGHIFGDNIDHPIGKLKVLLLNDNYEVIDSSVTDNLGTFRFKYLPFLKRFFLSAENTDNVLDVFKNILIYSSDDNLIKIMTHEKGRKFTYNPVSAEIARLREIEMEDPWLDLLDQKPKPAATASVAPVTRSIIENILFEYGKYEITPESKEILDKVILVLNANKALKLEIGAHTDSKGSDVSNMRLSEMRAKTVQSYIAHAGIDIGRLQCKGYGESKLLNDCTDNKPCSELEHAINRRIEFKILGE